MVQIKASLTSKRENRGLLDDSELVARMPDALSFGYITIAHLGASMVNDSC